MNNKLKTILQEKSSEKKNKSIEDITKKIQKIDKLKTSLKDLSDQILAIKLQVDEQSKTEKLLFCQTKEKYLLLLIEKYSFKGITQWQKDLISDMITEEHGLLMDFEYDSEEIQKAFSAFINLQTEEMTSFEKQMAQEAVNDMMAQFNFDENEMDFDFAKILDPKFKREFEEKMKEKIKNEQEKQKALEKQKQVAKTDIDFQKVYKKLAKLTHPDLHRSAEEKEIKEVQMQQLTKAWDERNYYDLLMVWLEVDPNNTIELEITENNQKNIIKQLNEQINVLEAETYNVKFQFKDTAFYYQNFYAANPKTVAKKIVNYTNTLLENAENTNEKVTLFQKTVNLKKYLKTVYDRQKSNDYNDFLRFMQQND